MRHQLFVIAGLTASAALFVPVVLRAQEQRAGRLKCSNHLRQLGLATLQYGDDKRFLPHVGPIRELDGGVETNHPTVKARALLYYGYLDQATAFVCPSSDDLSLAISDAEVRDNLRRWHWGRSTNPNPKTNPLLDLASDPKLSETTELSYGTTRRGYNSNLRSTTLIAADRAVRDGSTGALAGNHDDGWNCLKADASVEFLPYAAETAQLVVSTEKGGGFLALKDQRDASRLAPAGGGAAPKPGWVGHYEAQGVRIELEAVEWSPRTKSWGARGAVVERRDRFALVARGSGDALTGRVDVGSGLKIGIQDVKLRVDGDALVVESGGKTLRLPRATAPLDRQTANMVAVGLAVALKTGNLGAAREFLTQDARRELGEKGLQELSRELQQKSDRDLRRYLKLFEPLVVREGEVPRVALTLEALKEQDARPGGPRKPRSAQAAAIGALKTISSAQSLFREGDKDGDGILDYADGLEELGAAGLIDKVLASGVKVGYRFHICHGTSAPEFLWMGVANPVDGKGRSFAVNQSGVIFYRDGKPFELDPEKCEIQGGAPVGK